MIGYCVTDKRERKEIYSSMPKRFNGIWTYGNGSNGEDCIYIKSWENADLPSELENQKWEDDPIKVEIEISPLY